MAVVLTILPSSLLHKVSYFSAIPLWRAAVLGVAVFYLSSHVFK